MRYCYRPDTTTTKANGENVVARKKPNLPMTEADRRQAIFDRVTKNNETAVDEFGAVETVSGFG